MVPGYAVCGRNMEPNSHFLRQEKRKRTQGETFSPWGKSGSGANAHRGCVISVLGGFQDPVIMALSVLIWLHGWVCFEQEVGPETPWGSLQHPLIPWQLTPQNFTMQFLEEANTFCFSGIMHLLKIISDFIKEFYPVFVNYACDLKTRWQLSSKLSIPKLTAKLKLFYPFSAFLLFLQKNSPYKMKKTKTLIKWNINIEDNIHWSKLLGPFQYF